MRCNHEDVYYVLSSPDNGGLVFGLFVLLWVVMVMWCSSYVVYDVWEGHQTKDGGKDIV